MGVIYNKNGGVKVIEPVLKTKSITSNGTYNAASDNADGFSSVTVNVKAQRVALFTGGWWSGDVGDTLALNLSAYKFVYVVLNDGYHSTNLFLQVGGANGYAGGIPIKNGLNYGVAQGFKAKSTGIEVMTEAYAANESDAWTLAITDVYGITNID